jgi:RNA polymerase sigma-70 factor (ECF subfamily)
MNETVLQPDWPRWLDAHGPGFLLFARQQTPDEEEAQDLVQDALVEAWRRSGANGPPPVPLVFATLRRRAVDVARSRQRRSRRELVVSQEAAVAWFEPEVEQREMSALVQQALARLPAAQREVITLKVWAGLTFAEIADALGIPVNTAASRYRYGLEALRAMTQEVLA